MMIRVVIILNSNNEHLSVDSSWTCLEDDLYLVQNIAFLSLMSFNDNDLWKESI